MHRPFPHNTKESFCNFACCSGVCCTRGAVEGAPEQRGTGGGGAKKGIGVGFVLLFATICHNVIICIHFRLHVDCAWCTVRMCCEQTRQPDVNV